MKLIAMASSLVAGAVGFVGSNILMRQGYYDFLVPKADSIGEQVANYCLTMTAMEAIPVTIAMVAGYKIFNSFEGHARNRNPLA